MKKFSGYIKIALLILLSLTPVLWFFRKPGILIDGVDTNFPLDPSIWFHRRFFVWTAVSNAGADFSASTAGTFFHFLQFISFRLGFSLQVVELFSLLFWFSLIIISSWFLSELFFPKKAISQVIFVVLYSLNIWFFNSWENVKVANLALGAAIPMGLGILILLRKDKITRGLASVLSILTGIILAGAGINPAYIICFFVILTFFFLSEVFVDFGDWQRIVERLKDFLNVGIFIILVNMFWILPSIHFIFSNITASNSIGALGFTNWVDSLSQNTSLVNVIRMQGAWDWYSFDSRTGLPLYIPYALKYFNNPLFIGFSFLVPSLAFLAYFFKKNNKNFLNIFFGMMLVSGVFLTAGTHLPTGVIFNFFIRHVPFFSLFRSPWYIFAPLVGLSVAGLVSLFFNNINGFISNKIVNVVGVLFIIFSLIYSYPLLLGRVFRPASANGFFIKFPDYVYEVRDYLAKSSNTGRILSYPDDNIEKFTWGYSGTDSILNLFSDKEVIFSPLNDTTSPISKIVADLYQSLKKGQIDMVNRVADKLDINQVFYKMDQDSLSPILPKRILDNKIVNFDKWGFYSLGNVSVSKIRTVACCILSYPYNDSDKNISLLNKEEILVNPSDQLFRTTDLSNRSGAIVHAENSQVLDLNSDYSSIKSKLHPRDLNSVEFSFDVPQSGIYTPILEKYGIDSFGILNGNKLELLVDGESKIWTLNNSDDSYFYFLPVAFQSGEHKLIIQLKNKNLVDSSNFTQNGIGFFGENNGIMSIFNTSDKDVNLDFKIFDFDPYSYYLVGVTYQQIYGNNAQILVNQAKSSTLFKSQAESMPNYPDWQDFSFYYSPVELASSMDIKLVAPQVKDPLGTKVQYKNLGVYKVFSNDLFFKEQAQGSGMIANINYKEDSPIHYTGNVTNSSGPQIIIFNENYSSDWLLNVKNSTPAKIFHFTGDYYANAWYINGPTGNYTFTISYKPQSLLKTGYVIAAISVLSAIAYFIYNLARRKNGK